MFEKETVIFDFDGTLMNVSEREYIAYCLAYQTTCPYEFLKIKPLTKEDFLEKKRVKTPIKELLPSFFKDSDVATFSEKRHSLIEQSDMFFFDQPFVNTTKILEFCHKNYKIVVVSGRKNLQSIWQQSLFFKFGHFIDEVYVCDRNEKSTVVKRQKNVKFVVGDSEHDMYAAIEAGVPTIFVTTGIRSRDFLQLLASNRRNDVIDICDDIEGVLKFL